LDLGWRWLRNDGSWTAFGHTGPDANVCLMGTRCATHIRSPVDKGDGRISYPDAIS